MEFDLDYVEDFIDVSQRCTQPLELRDAFLNHSFEFGFEKLGAANIVDRPIVMQGDLSGEGGNARLGTYPEIWHQRFYEARYFEVDPITLKANTSNVPFFWQDCYEELEHKSGWSDRGKSFLAESSELGLVRGLTIPILNGSARSSINLCGNNAEGGAGVMHMLHLTAIYFHQRLLALDDSFSLITEQYRVRLTPRETEVLRWYAKGKSAWDISVVLSVSESAIRFHLSNIRGKYGVASSVHATALAISRSDIHL